jgi:hypothetical protein
MEGPEAALETLLGTLILEGLQLPGKVMRVGLLLEQVIRRHTIRLQGGGVLVLPEELFWLIMLRLEEVVVMDLLLRSLALL